MQNEILRQIEEAISGLNGVLQKVIDGDTSEIKKRLAHLENARHAILKNESKQSVVQHIRRALGFSTE